MEILHILNGDATLQGFQQTGLDGETLIWREVLSEGPLGENIRSASFWKARSEWICAGFNETPDKYQESVLNPLARLSGPCDEINLWFEFDLHCQANLMGVMNYLKQNTDLSLPPIYLICPSEFPGVANFRGMGELNGEQLEYLYDNIRVQLNEIDFVVAAEAWQNFIQKDASVFQQYLDTNTIWGSLKCLRPALEAHLKRLQINKNGLNHIEQKLLDIYNAGARDQREIYAQFWEAEKIYGMGDLEISIYLNGLREKRLIDY
jgi:Domain of unknown function (DUF1835)